MTHIFVEELSMFWYFQDFVVTQLVGNLLDHFRHDLYIMISSLDSSLTSLLLTVKYYICYDCKCDF